VRAAIEGAVKMDPGFALARAYQAFVGTGTPSEKESTINGVLREMNSASAAEYLLAVYWRESAAGRGEAALPVFRAVADLVPADPEIVWEYVLAASGGKPVEVRSAL